GIVVASPQTILAGELVVKAGPVAADIRNISYRHYIVTERAGRADSRQIRQGHKIQKGLGPGIDPVRRNAVVRKRLARERVDDRRQAGKITIAHGSCANRQGVGTRKTLPQALVAAVKERLIVNNRTTQGEPKFVPVERRVGQAGCKKVSP